MLDGGTGVGVAQLSATGVVERVDIVPVPWGNVLALRMDPQTYAVVVVIADDTRFEALRFVYR